MAVIILFAAISLILILVKLFKPTKSSSPNPFNEVATTSVKERVYDKSRRAAILKQGE